MIAGKDGRPCDEWVLFYTFDSPLALELARAFLEAEGIPCYVNNEHRAKTGYQNLWPLQLLVPASKLARARELSEMPVCDDEVVEEAERQWEESGGAGRDSPPE